MKLWLVYIIIFSLGLISFIVLITKSSSPEEQILGEWKEMSWDYEKVNKPNKASLRDYSSAEIKQLIGQDLVIHEAEKWEFLPNGQLKLIGEDTIKMVNWRIKGRGHILQIKYDDGVIENYNITVLRNKKLVLNFDLDVKAKGIAQLTFNKI